MECPWSQEIYPDTLRHIGYDSCNFQSNDSEKKINVNIYTTPILGPPHEKSWLIGKDPDAGRDWGQEEKGKTDDEVAGWHHQLDEPEFD